MVMIITMVMIVINDNGNDNNNNDMPNFEGPANVLLTCKAGQHPPPRSKGSCRY